MEGMNPVPAKTPERAPETVRTEELLALMTEDAAARFAAIAPAIDRGQYLERISDFNALGQEQLNRADEEIAQVLENESLASREEQFEIVLPQGRRLRVMRAKNGVVTLSDATLG